MMLLIVRIVCGVIVIGVTGAGLLVAWAKIHRPHGRHQLPAPAPRSPRRVPGYTTAGSMWWPEERDWRARVRADGIVYTDDAGEIHVKPWEAPHGAEAGALWPKYGLWNGHTFGCLRPDEDHRGACPEEGDDPDDPYGWPPLSDLPEMLPAAPADDQSSLVDAALALGADDPGDAGWTDQLLADLHNAPTVLDVVRDPLPSWVPERPATEEGTGGWGAGIDGSLSPAAGDEPTRLADTGEIELASLRADYAAELRAQDDDAAEFISRQATGAAEFRLEVNGL